MNFNNKKLVQKLSFEEIKIENINAHTTLAKYKTFKVKIKKSSHND